MADFDAIFVPVQKKRKASRAESEKKKAKK